MRPVDQRARLFVVEAFERDGVDLDLEPAATAASIPAITCVEVAPAGDAAELVGIERVERDIDPADAAVGKLVRESRELGAVGRQRQLVERAALEMAPSRAKRVITLRRTSGSPPVMRSLRVPSRRKPSTAGRVPRATACPAWAESSCPRTCNRRSGNRSGPSPRRAHRPLAAERIDERRFGQRAHCVHWDDVHHRQPA